MWLRHAENVKRNSRKTIRLSYNNILPPMDEQKMVGSSLAHGTIRHSHKQLLLLLLTINIDVLVIILCVLLGLTLLISSSSPSARHPPPWLDMRVSSMT